MLCPEELNASQNRLEESFIRVLVARLSTDVQPLILADRGFSRASLLTFLNNLERNGKRVDYVMWLIGDVIVNAGKFRGKLCDCPLRKRRIVFIPNALYRQDAAVMKMYRRRMYPEQSIFEMVSSVWRWMWLG